MAACNPNIDTYSCTLQTCCWQQGIVQYPPNLAASVAYLTIFVLFLLSQFGIGLWYRTWGFFVGMVCGLILEVIGYTGRLLVRQNPFNISIFLVYFIPLGLGPAFMTASIYLILARIVVVYGPQYSYFRPGTYTIVFVSIDITSLIIQAVGGSLSASATNDAARQKGVDALITGLSFQAASLAGFITMAALFARKVRKGRKEDRTAEFSQLRDTRKFKLFVGAVAVAAVTIFIRCVYRVIELAQGFSGTIANSETPFLILEGPLIMSAMLAVTVFHPGIVFRGGYWKKANWQFKQQYVTEAEKQESLESDSDR